MTTLFQRLTRLLPPPPLILILGVLLLSACGGGGGGGSGGSPATANSQNFGNLGVAANAGIKQAIADSGNSTEIPTTLSRGDTNRTTHIELAKYLVAQTLTQRSAKSSAKSPTQTTARAARDTFTGTGNCGGSATLIGTEQSGTIQYNNYCVDSVTANGTVTYSFASSSFTFTYSNFTFSDSSGETYNVRSLTINCRTTNGSESCTYSSDFTGNNNITYTSSNARVTGSSSSGYSVTVTVSDPEFGTITIAASNIAMCANGNIRTGTISITDSTGSAVINVTFPGCDTFIVTYNGVAETYSQNTYAQL